MKAKIRHFLIYGAVGWIMEITFTGIGSILRGDPRLTGWTYLWMFPIYGSAVMLEPVHDMIRHVPAWLRGIFWTGVIIAVEYFSGLAIRVLVGVCPWDYGESAFAVDGLIRLDYVPFWYVVGLLFERLHNLLDRVES
ncbi:putative ABC transporter permease [Thermosediminibacter litoriperuensis]|nr:hypothetical protein [Thermosediminibacter litoriperuensis]